MERFLCIPVSFSHARLVNFLDRLLSLWLEQQQFVGESHRPSDSHDRRQRLRNGVAIMKPHLALCLLFSGCLQTIRAGEALPLVELHFRNKQVVLTEPGQQRASRLAMQLLETSNFHSGPGDKYHMFTLSDTQRKYRQVVAGKFLLVSFPEPRKVTTIGGEIVVSEIVLGLNRDDYAMGLFTIDATGSVVAHSKYSGVHCVEILKTVKQFANND